MIGVARPPVCAIASSIRDCGAIHPSLLTWLIRLSIRERMVEASKSANGSVISYSYCKSSGHVPNCAGVRATITNALKRLKTGVNRSKTWAKSAPATPGKSKVINGKSPFFPSKVATISSTNVFVEGGTSCPTIRQNISCRRLLLGFSPG